MPTWIQYAQALVAPFVAVAGIALACGNSAWLENGYNLICTTVATSFIRPLVGSSLKCAEKAE
jgi:hypothetical protein